MENITLIFHVKPDFPVLREEIGILRFPTKIAKFELLQMFEAQLNDKIGSSLMKLTIFAIAINGKRRGFTVVTDESPFIVDRHVTSVEFAWKCEIGVFPFGSGIQRKKSADSMYGTITMTSNQSFESVQRKILGLYPQTVALSGEVGIMMDEATVFSRQTFDNPKPHLTVFLLPLKSSYSAFTLSRLIPVMDFDFDFLDLLGKGNAVQGAKLERDQNFIAFFAHLNQNTTRVQKSISKLNAVLANSGGEYIDKFRKLHELCKLNLDYLSQHYEPQEDLNEAGRQIIITHVVEVAAAMCNFQWKAEKELFDDKHRGALGWGPLDLYLEPAHILTFEPVKSGTECVDKGSSLVDVKSVPIGTFIDMLDAAKPLVIRSAPDVHPADEEDGEMEATEADDDSILETQETDTKRSSPQQGLAQLAAQLYDIGMLNETKGNQVVNGVLSTGRMWRYFSLVFKDGSRPKLFFDGQVPLRAIRLPYCMNHATPISEENQHRKARKVTLNQTEQKVPMPRPSENFLNESEVDPHEVENAVNALIGAFLVHDNLSDFGL